MNNTRLIKLFLSFVICCYFCSSMFSNILRHILNYFTICCSGSQPVRRDTQVCREICSSVPSNLKISYEVPKNRLFLPLLIPIFAANFFYPFSVPRTQKGWETLIYCKERIADIVNRWHSCYEFKKAGTCQIAKKNYLFICCGNYYYFLATTCDIWYKGILQ